MKLIFIRHGKTAGNLERRYIGRTDEPLCDEGIAEISGKEYPDADIVVASPMKRCVQTAELIYPHKEIKLMPSLRETDFGDFEGLNYEQLCNDISYRSWIEGGGNAAPPNGESREQFCTRCCCGFIQAAAENRGKAVAFVVHGGTIMAIAERFAFPKKGFYDYQVKNGGGYTAELDHGKITITSEF